MADKPNDQPTEAEKQKALAEAQAQALANRADEGEEGGHYIVNGVHVNADGQPLDKYNKKSDKDSK